MEIQIAKKTVFEVRFSEASIERFGADLLFLLSTTEDVDSEPLREIRERLHAFLRNLRAEGGL